MFTITLRRHPRPGRAFTLIEMITVIAVMSILLVAGAGLLSGTGAQARKVSTDTLVGMIERARAEAITTRSDVVLALAAPGDLPSGDAVCRLGLFRVDEWPGEGVTQVDAELLSRWRALKPGVALVGGVVDGVDNPLDGEELTIRYGAGGETMTVEVHALAFHPRGGLRFPEGSAPVAMRVAEGRYENGVAVPNMRGGKISENLLKIGRVVGRPYRID